jgi:hypothetical protein
MSYEKKNLPTGKPNPKYIDLLYPKMITELNGYF